jgi:hypothetical protein
MDAKLIKQVLVMVAAGVIVNVIMNKIENSKTKAKEIQS